MNEYFQRHGELSTFALAPTALSIPYANISRGTQYICRSCQMGALWNSLTILLINWTRGFYFQIYSTFTINGDQRTNSELNNAGSVHMTQSPKLQFLSYSAHIYDSIVLWFFSHSLQWPLSSLCFVESIKMECFFFPSLTTRRENTIGMKIMTSRNNGEYMIYYTKIE